VGRRWAPWPVAVSPTLWEGRQKRRGKIVLTGPPWNTPSGRRCVQQLGPSGSGLEGALAVRCRASFAFSSGLPLVPPVRHVALDPPRARKPTLGEAFSMSGRRRVAPCVEPLDSGQDRRRPRHLSRRENCSHQSPLGGFVSSRAGPEIREPHPFPSGGQERIRSTEPGLCRGRGARRRRSPEAARQIPDQLFCLSSRLPSSIIGNLGIVKAPRRASCQL